MPYGEGCASGDLRRTCLVARSDVSVSHKACPTGTKAVPVAMSDAHASWRGVTCRLATRHAPPRLNRQKSFFMGPGALAPAGECRGRAAALCRGARGRVAPASPRRETVARSLRRPSIEERRAGELRTPRHAVSATCVSIVRKSCQATQSRTRRRGHALVYDEGRRQTDVCNWRLMPIWLGKSQAR